MFYLGGYAVPKSGNGALVLFPVKPNYFVRSRRRQFIINDCDVLSSAKFL